MGITLAKSLKCKNRLAQRIGKVSGDIQTYNSRPAGSISPVDVETLYATRQEFVAKLSELKLKIIQANVGIWAKIVRISEAKGEIDFWKRVPTTDGKNFAAMGYRDTELLEYEAVYKKSDVDAKISELEKEVDKLQDAIDVYNHNTTVDFVMPD